MFHNPEKHIKTFIIGYSSNIFPFLLLEGKKSTVGAGGRVDKKHTIYTPAFMNSFLVKF